MDYPISSHSWEVISKKVAFKKMDKSSFHHHGTAIPRAITSFFDIQEYGIEEKREITLQINNRNYKANLKETNQERFKLIWHSDLQYEINQLFPDIASALKSSQKGIKTPQMRFEKQESDLFSLSFEHNELKKQFSIKKSNSLIQIINEDSRKLNAEVTSSKRDEWVDYIFESRGGGKDDPNERNPDYYEALEVVLFDAQVKSWQIQDIVVVSKKLEDLPLSQKRVHPENFAYPIRLNEEIDLIALRKAISLSVSKVGQKPGSAGGNPTKRIRVTFSSIDLKSTLEGDSLDTHDVLKKYHQKKINHKFKKSGPPPSGQRKASKIEQNKIGYTYVFKLEGVKEDALKIGFTANLSKRLNDLNSEIRPSVTGLSWEPVTFWQFNDVFSAYEFEQEIQSKLRDSLYEGEREIFKISVDDLSSILGKQ